MRSEEEVRKALRAVRIGLLAGELNDDETVQNAAAGAVALVRWVLQDGQPNPPSYDNIDVREVHMRETLTYRIANYVRSYLEVGGNLETLLDELRDEFEAVNEADEPTKEATSECPTA